MLRISISFLRLIKLFALVFLFLVICSDVRAGDEVVLVEGQDAIEQVPGDGIVRFNRDVRPILNQHCIACHGGVKQAADLSFVYEDQSDWVVEPGDAHASYLIERVTSDEDEDRMPPPDHGPKLTENEISLLRTWIDQGAKREKHWAFERPRLQVIPEVSDRDWPRSRIDSFILSRLEQAGIQPNAEATSERWLRRVSLDLIGLPPTGEERAAFLKNVAKLGEPAYRKEVARLLNSPRFGERWASVWLDLVRYADSKGLGQDGRRTIWKYRDWVIKSLNRDLGYDDFTIQQIAGDLLPDGGLDELVATACHRSTQTNEEGGTDDEQFRVEAVIDRVNTTWQTWQGLTFGCVQCHNHPYDPIRHEEYYQFLAFFNNTADSDLSDDEPRVAVPLSDSDLQTTFQLEETIRDRSARIWSSGHELAGDSSRWHSLKLSTARTNNETGLAIESDNGLDQFVTRGTVSQNTRFVVEAALPEGVRQITAVRFSGLPHSPSQAIKDSEWGFVLSHFQVELISPDNSEPILLPLAYVIGDEAEPLLDPQSSLDPKTKQGFAAYTRIHFPRTAIFVLKESVPVSAGSLLRCTLEHRDIALGAFPLVTRRGHFAVSEDVAFVEWLNSAELARLSQERDSAKKALSGIKSVKIPIMRERPDSLRRPTYLFERGNFLTKGDEVQSATPDFLRSDSQTLVSNRLELARWLADEKNPLTARVLVNRVWGQMFGTGLVLTQEDFGSSGEPPTHPELLDDLAVRFVTEMDWSLKTLVEEIALSTTYRQSSRATAEQIAKDPGNRWLGRGTRSRLPAETVRDQALSIAGLLSASMFGPPVHPPIPNGVWMPFQGGDKWETPKEGDPQRYRRSIYTYTKRTIPYPMFATFDAPSREFCTPRRLASNTPLQALMTLNDQTFIDASHALAEKMMISSKRVRQQIRFGMETATCRTAETVEVDDLFELYRSNLRQLKRAKMPAIKSGEVKLNSIKLEAMTGIAILLLNLDEVLCK